MPFSLEISTYWITGIPGGIPKFPFRPHREMTPETRFSNPGSISVPFPVI